MFTGIIRKINQSDYAAVEQIYALYWADKASLEKLSDRLRNSDNFHYFVAEENSEIFGIVGTRKLPERMTRYSTTTRPCELYILAVRKPGNGVGKILLDQSLTDIRNSGYTEMIVYSHETYQNFWSFYDKNGFERVAVEVDQKGERGQIWRMVL